MQAAPHSEPISQRSIALPTYASLGLFIFVVLGMTVFQSIYIYPRFIQLLIDTTEDEGIRIGNNMMRVVIQDYHNGLLTISNETKITLDQSSEDYNLSKIKIFSASGETIYSTDTSDLGTINNHDYFHDIVAKGKVYTTTIYKNTKNMEKQIVQDDFLQTYIPIIVEDTFVGAFELYYNISARKEAMDEIMVRNNTLFYGVTAFFIIIVLAIALGLRQLMKERKAFEDRLYALANEDSLTGLINRRRFLELLKWEVEKHLRYRVNVSLLMFDIDHFKIINDTYGHQAGDEVLQDIAKVCKEVTRKTDLIARYGGEEFVILLPATKQSSATDMAERLRQSVMEKITVYETFQIRVTISIGVVDFTEIEELTIDTAIKEVDDCLYKAKNSGRNRVCVHQC